MCFVQADYLLEGNRIGYKLIIRGEIFMKKYETITMHMEQITTSLSSYATKDVISKLERMKCDFNRKIEDFHREGRKLNIGVIGRVKAGKSSFLNTLLFEGKEVLPKAATPKTATLTKIEYSEINRVEIEFYSKEDWEIIKDDALYDEDGECGKSAKELLEMAKERNLDIDELLQKGKEEQVFENYDALVQYLNQYIGENGKYTPLVRCVCIYMDKEELKEVSIVDTPGLNDTVHSRTQRTREFIELCDAVFFLSRAGQFLAKEDLDLLCNQLPQKGVKKMVLIASQYDGALRDEIKEKGNADAEMAFFGKDIGNDTITTIPEAQKKIKHSLSEHAKYQIAKISSKKDVGNNEIVSKVLEECKAPVFVSARFHDIAMKKYEEYNAEEKADYDYWMKHIDNGDIKEQFRELGNFDAVRKLYEEIKAEKERLFAEKQEEFVPTFYTELYQYLAEQRDKTESKLAILKTSDTEKITAQKADVTNRLDKITADIGEVFGKIYEAMKKEKAEVVKKLRESSVEASKLEVHTGTEHHTGSYTSYAVNIGPFKFGGKTEHYSYTTTYKYLSAGDALDQIRTYGKDAASEIETTFLKVVNFQMFRKQLMDVVLDNFDAGSKDFSVDYFRSVVREAIDRIDYPTVEINVTDELAAITAKFSGEVRDNREQDKFRQLLIDVIEKMYQGILNKVEVVTEAFRSSMEGIKSHLKEDILESVLREFELIQQAFANKEQEICTNEAYLAEINRIAEECKEKGRR